MPNGKDRTKVIVIVMHFNRFFLAVAVVKYPKVDHGKFFKSILMRLYLFFFSLNKIIIIDKNVLTMFQINIQI